MIRKLSIVAVLLSVLTIGPAMGFSERMAPPQAKKATADKEQHPHIRAAIQELKEARKELETAAHDFGGHRKEAIEAVDTAIKQLQQALQYDKK